MFERWILRNAFYLPYEYTLLRKCRAQVSYRHAYKFYGVIEGLRLVKMIISKPENKQTRSFLARREEGYNLPGS